MIGQECHLRNLNSKNCVRLKVRDNTEMAISEYIPNTFEIFSLLRSLRLSVRLSSVSMSSTRSSFVILFSSNFAKN